MTGQLLSLQAFITYVQHDRFAIVSVTKQNARLNGSMVMF